MTVKYRATEQRLLALLGDGKFHRREELTSCLYDTEAEMRNLLDTLQKWLSLLRKKIQPLGRDIICELDQGRRIGYRLVIRVSSVKSD